MQTSGELTRRGHFPLDWQGPGSRDLVRGWDISSRARFNFASAALHTRAGTRGRKPAALTVPASLGRFRRSCQNGLRPQGHDAFPGAYLGAEMMPRRLALGE